MKAVVSMPAVTWGQLLVRGMTPEVAGIIMGVPAGVAEWELRRAANASSVASRQSEKAALFLQSNFPTIEPREKPRL